MGLVGNEIGYLSKQVRLIRILPDRLVIYRDEFNDHFHTCEDINLSIDGEKRENAADELRTCSYCENPVFPSTFTHHLGVCPEADHEDD